MFNTTKLVMLMAIIASLFSFTSTSATAQTSGMYGSYVSSDEETTIGVTLTELGKDQIVITHRAPKSDGGFDTYIFIGTITSSVTGSATISGTAFKNGDPDGDFTGTYSFWERTEPIQDDMQWAGTGNHAGMGTMASRHIPEEDED